MNSFGQIFRVSIFGESHGSFIGITIDGCPPGIEIKEQDFIKELNRRKSRHPGSTSRAEQDKPEFISGVYNRFTTGAPLTILFKNTDANPDDYKDIKDTPRPGHADYSNWIKYSGFNDYRGGGHSSGRLTAGLVVAGVIAKQILEPVLIEAELTRAGGSTDIDKSISKAIEENDSIGGLITCRINNVPGGLGEPFFNSAESMISHAMFSIPGIKAIEFGDGIQSAT